MFVQLHTNPTRVASFESMSPRNNWFYEKSYKAPVYVPQHEVVFGLYMATRKTRTDKVKGFNTLEELKTAYKNSIIKVSEDVMYDDRLTTYGRAIVANIIGTELDNILGEGVPITAGNISEVVRFLGTRENRVTALQRLQNFGSEIATHVGLDSLPFDNIYGDDTKNIKAITESAEPVGVRVNKLKKYLEDTMTAKLNKNPDSNLSHLIKGSGRVKYSQLVEIYAPTMIIKGDKIVIDKSNVFEGLSQRAYTELAKNNRVLLEMKNELTPVGGYDNRQLVNLQMRLTYRNIENPNPDKIGVLIPRKFALGRTTLDGEIIKSNNDNDLVRVRSTINNSGNIVYRDEIDSTKMSIMDGSGIGCNFATALMEGVTQAALALKHGGSTINYENYVVTSLEDGVVTAINNNYLEVTGKHIYKYILSLYASANVKLSVGSKVSVGDKLIYSTKRTEIDQALRNFNTLVDTHVTGALGAKSKKILSYSPFKGKLKYDIDNGFLSIGGHAVPYERDYLYYLPEGYEVNIGDQLSTGVLDMTKFKSLVPDIGIVYSVFYKTLCTGLLRPEGFYNSETVETLFKSIIGFGFSVEVGNNNNPNYLERVYKGNTKGSLEEAIKNSPSGTIEIGDTLLLPILMRNKETSIGV